MATPGAVEAKGTGGGTDKMAALKEIYNKLKAEVLEDHAIEVTHESAIQWIDRVMLDSSPLTLHFYLYIRVFA